MKFTIGKKLWSMTLLMLIILTILGVTAYERVQLINSTLGNIIDNEMIQTEASKAMEIQVNRIGIGVLGYLLNEEPEHVERITHGINGFTESQKQYNDLCTTDKGRELGGKIKQEFDRIVSLSTSLVEEKKRQSELLKLLYGDYKKMDKILNNDIQATIKPQDPLYAKKMKAAMEMEININKIIKEMNGFLIFHGDSYLDSINQDKQIFISSLKTYQTLDLSSGEMQRSRDMEGMFDANIQRMENIVAIEKKERADLSTTILLRRSIQSILVDEVQALTARDLDMAENNSRNAVKTTLIMVISLALIGFILGGLGSYFISRSISVPLERLSKWADRVAARDFSIQEIKTSNDEIGHLNACFKQMTADLRQFSDQTMNAVRNINSTSAEILAAIQQQSTSIKEQAAAIQETSSTMEEIRETGSQVSERAKRVAQAAEATSSTSDMGIRAVEDTNAIMESIRVQVEQVAQNIVTLSEKTLAIGDIISTVNDIAERSNLLALNAAIEAVGAGKQGERFSVVANEMKRLADQAKESTIEVRSILNEIQNGINKSVMSTEEAVKRVETGRLKSEVAAETIKQLTDTTTESTVAFQQIVAGTGQQQIGLDQVSLALKDIDQGTEQTASGIGQIESAVANLNELSGILKTIVEGD
ncbi:MAG: methyl-accepting chemotaxis protein [Desulfobacula sp.]|jgi:methyl-accepting chemotaxis protein